MSLRPRIPTLLALGAVAACAGTPPPPPQPRVNAAEQPPPAPEPAQPLPARWVDTSGATTIGPAVSGGTLVLLGGRRALIGADRSVRPETAPCPEPLAEIVEVPGASAQRRLVARGTHGIYRLDDPLGAPVAIARSEVDLSRLGAAPGLVALWDIESDLPRFIDIETGQPATLQGLPAPPLRAIAFTDARNGAAVFEAAGLAVTTDGGASWRLSGEAVAGDAMRVNGLRLRGGQLRAFAAPEGRDGPVDPAQAKLGPADDPPPADSEPAIARWIRVTQRDPLEAAIASGIEAAPGIGLAASHGLLATVDMRTGVALEAAEFAKDSGASSCAVGGTERAAWVACAMSEDTSEDFYDPFGVLRVPLDGARLAPERPTIRRNGEAELRTSPSGGAMLLAACNVDDEGVACVRQPSGRWMTVESDIDFSERGAGPLVDGRIAFLRGLWAGDEAPGGEDENEEAAERAHKPFIAILGEGGKERRVAAFSVPGGEQGSLRAVSPIEEAEDHTLAFVVADDAGVISVVQPPGREDAVVHRLEGVTHARIHAGRGVAVGEGQLLTSPDGGLIWTRTPAPGRVLEAIDELGSILDEPGALAVNTLGVKIDTQLRIGWGPPEDDARREPGDAAAPSIQPLPRRNLPALPGPEQALGCTTQGPGGQGTPPLLGAHQTTALLTRGAPPAPPGSDRRSSPASAGRWGMLDAVGLLEDQGPKAPPGAPASSPATWTLRWFDPGEVQGKPRSWTGPAPRGMGWGTTVRAVAASGDRALFSLRAGGKHLLVRIKPGAGIETADVPWELMPGGEVVFGADRGDPIAWLHDTSVVVWRSGEAPRAIAAVSSRGARTLGQPTKDGVPLLLSSTDWALARVLPIPPPAKAAAAPIPLDGWSAAPNLRRDITRFPACGAGPKGTRFVIQRGAGETEIDGQRHFAQSIVYDVRVHGGEACVASMAALLTPGGPAAAPRKGGAGPVSFARADLVGKRADGGDRGIDPPGGVRRLACSLSPRR